MNPVPDAVGLIAGNGRYPFEWAAAARQAGVRRLVAAAFENETDPALAELVDEISWMRVGQLGRLLGGFRKAELTAAVMAGQIAPKNLFELSPDFKALAVLARLKRRNAETIFSAIGEELEKIGIPLLNATTFMEKSMAPVGLIAGPKLRTRQIEDLEYGFGIAKSVSAMDIGQTVVVRNGTVLAVEGFEGTNAAIRRGGELGRKGSTMVKVSKPNQDLRFDVPVIGPATLEVAATANVAVIGIEAGKTLILEMEKTLRLAQELKVAVYGLG